MSGGGEAERRAVHADAGRLRGRRRAVHGRGARLAVVARSQVLNRVRGVDSGRPLRFSGTAPKKDQKEINMKCDQFGWQWR